MRKEIAAAYLLCAWLCLNLGSIALVLAFGRETNLLIFGVFGVDLCLLVSCLINYGITRFRSAKDVA